MVNPYFEQSQAMKHLRMGTWMECLTEVSWIIQEVAQTTRLTRIVRGRHLVIPISIDICVFLWHPRRAFSIGVLVETSGSANILSCEDRM